MSLSEAVLLIAERIEQEAKSKDDIEHDEYCYERHVRILLKSLANELRIAVKASEGTEQVRPSVLGQGYDPVAAKDLHRQMIRAAREEFRGKVPKIESMVSTDDLIETEERLDNRMLTCVGGSNDGIMIPVPPKTPIGKELTAPTGEVYQLREDNQLHYVRRIEK